MHFCILRKQQKFIEETNKLFFFLLELKSSKLCLIKYAKAFINSSEISRFKNKN